MARLAARTAGTTTATGAMPASTGPFRIGGNAVWDEFYAGLIDDLRLYNRALTATEIQADMATPVAQDTAAPSTPTGLTVTGRTGNSISLSWTASTDNVGVAGVQFALDGANLGAEDTTSPYSISWDTTTASNGSHSLSARARDAAGNTTTSSAVIVTVSNGTGPRPGRPAHRGRVPPRRRGPHPLTAGTHDRPAPPRPPEPVRLPPRPGAGPPRRRTRRAALPRRRGVELLPGLPPRTPGRRRRDRVRRERPRPARRTRRAATRDRAVRRRGHSSPT